MRAVVTGGAGFIGSHLVRALVDRGDSVTVVDNLSTGNRGNLAAVTAAAELAEIDLSRPDPALVRLLVGADCVFHLAALPSVPASVADPLRSHASCATATLNLLQAMHEAGVGRIVYASSCALYGEQPERPWRTDMAPLPGSPYAADKLAGEQYLAVFHRLYGFDAASLRYFNVYGPGQAADSSYAAAIPLFLEALREGRRPTVYGDGLQTRDFVHVRDVVAANLLAAERASGCPVLNVASGEPISILELLRLLYRLAGKGVEPAFAPARPGEIRHSVGDVSATRAAIGFAPAVRLEAGLAELLR